MSRVLPDGNSLSVESEGPTGRPSFSLGGQEDEYRPDLDDDFYPPSDEEYPEGVFRRVESTELIIPIRQKYKVIKNWLFGCVLGEGSYAKVKEVLHVQTLQRAAVKIIKKRRLRKIPNGENNVKKELKILRRLKHHNIIHLIDFHFNPEKEKIYIFMEHCVTTLQDMLDTAPDKKLPIHQTHRYFIQLIDGLEYLHDSRVIHKDIKPGNLLLSNAQILKITDFGVAEEITIFAPDDTCYISTGTPRFQPPEIASGLNSFKGPAVDIWAAGITLFNCITGAYPFNGDNIYKLYEQIEACDLRVPKEVTNDMETVLRGMLEKHFDERFSLNQIRNSVWFRRRHPKIGSDHFSDIAAIKRELNDCSTTCFNALCRLHNQPSNQSLHEQLPTVNILDALRQADLQDGHPFQSEPVLHPHSRTNSLQMRSADTRSETGKRSLQQFASFKARSRSSSTRCKPS